MCVGRSSLWDDASPKSVTSLHETLLMCWAGYGAKLSLLLSACYDHE